MAYRKRGWQQSDERQRKYKFEKRRAKMTAAEARAHDARLFGICADKNKKPDGR